MFTKLLNVFVLVGFTSFILSCSPKDGLPVAPEVFSTKASARVFSYVPSGEASYFLVSIPVFTKNT